MSDTFIVSVGYERRSVEDLVSVLIDYGVRKLLDVREAPVSRRQGFSKRSLAARLDEAGIEYRHLRIAGNPHRRLRETSSDASSSTKTTCAKILKSWRRWPRRC